MTIFVLNGPNLNLLGSREQDVYGAGTLGDLEDLCTNRAQALGHDVDFRQTNYEGELVDWLQEARTSADGVVLNAAAFTHYSIAVRDAIVACERPVIEVHLSNIFGREDFRSHSTISAVCAGVICGLGYRGYQAAIDALASMLASGSSS